MANQAVEDIKSRLNIVDVIADYIQLKRAGANFQANCPFHGEKTASFVVNPSRQIWHCFGCGLGGDVFSFIMQYENSTFPEVLELLAGKAGVVLPTRDSRQIQNESKQALFIRINTFAAAFYHKVLLGAAAVHAKAYITNRGLTDSIIKEWQVGFAPNDFHALENQFRKKKVAAADLVAAGVVVKSEKGAVYDRFRNRITFPILDFTGKVVGFTARILELDSQSAKYINSPETPIYSKGKTLFGLYQAKNPIRKRDEVVMVEGPMDCIQAHQAGFTNTVATNGTAVTLDQLRLLARLTKTIKLCFDTDVAGQLAAKKTALIALGMGFGVKIITFASAKDPDELIRNNPQEWQNAVDKSIWFIDHYIQKGLTEFTYASLEQKHFIVQAVLPLVQRLQSAVDRDHYIQLVSERFGISRSSLAEAKGDIQALTLVPELNTSIATSPESGEAQIMEKEVAAGVIFYSELREMLAGENYTSDMFTSLALGRAVEHVLSGQPHGLDQALYAELQFMLELREQEHPDGKSVLVRELEKSCVALKLGFIKQNLQRLSSAIKQAEIANQRDELLQLNNQFVTFVQERQRLELRG
jgi:DNA primase